MSRIGLGTTAAVLGLASPPVSNGSRDPAPQAKTTVRVALRSPDTGLYRPAAITVSGITAAPYRGRRLSLRDRKRRGAFSSPPLFGATVRDGYRGGWRILQAATQPYDRTQWT